MSNGNNPSRGPKRQSNDQRAIGNVTKRPIGRSREPFQWSDIPASDVGEFVQSVTRSGAALICGVTSDGGALSVTILDGEERYRDWPSNLDEFARLADWVREGLTFA